MRTQDVTLKTCRRRWMIGRNGERGSGISALAARHDDDDDDETIQISFENSYDYKHLKNKLPEFLRRSLMIFIIKDFRTIVFIFIVIFRVRQTPEEGRRTYRQGGNNNKDEDNNPKTLNDKKKLINKSNFSIQSPIRSRTTIYRLDLYTRISLYEV